MISIDVTVLVTALTPFIVALSDVFGRRNVYLLSLFFFTVCTLVCCLANNFTQLLAGCSLQGVGSSGLLLLGLVIVTDVVLLRERPSFVGINQLSWA
ncbi:uncharacterized protein LTHEOB_5338 [Neofusicoccum parvum]|uniref:Uncharacterized protein LTHEOB_5338 n=1 Tax=Neofusicoccum parvum TaxID=310453 RepID=A0ACB5SA07_9PEZI|nr:uncharacterized protein LTHEOB_5338 [Neofusicoccum parvum]